MKKLLYILSFASLLGFGYCSDELNTEPTDSVSGSTIFENVTNAQSAINGVYRMLYVAGWSTNWAHENSGQTGIQLLADLMADDHLMYAQGQGWYYEDYRLNVHGDYSNTAGRPYAVWNFYYTIISNVNYIIAAENTMEGDATERDNLVGQAYAMRAFCYFYLIQLYQQTYHGHETAPGVPIYTEPTEAGSQGHPRGTVQDVYDQINSDLDRAIELLEGKSQSHISHVDYYVANGFKARVALVQHEYETAAAAATAAVSPADAASFTSAVTAPSPLSDNVSASEGFCTVSPSASASAASPSSSSAFAAAYAVISGISSVSPFSFSYRLSYFSCWEGVSGLYCIFSSIALYTYCPSLNQRIRSSHSSRHSAVIPAC